MFGMTAADARDRLLTIQANIDALNVRKSGYQEAWEQEKKRALAQGELEPEKPAELRGYNAQLGPLYTEKESLLARFPQFVAEFGVKKQGGKKNFAPTSSFPSARQMHEVERSKKKAGIPVAFKEWAAKQNPQVNQGLRGWEDPAIRRRYEADMKKHWDSVAGVGGGQS